MMYSKAQIKRRAQALVGPLYRVGLKNKDFTIISNNCWGGAVYDKFRLPYRTPTIGLWFPSEDYLRFLHGLDFYLKKELVKISWQESNARDLLARRKDNGRYKFPLDELIMGRIEDVDIVFLHYSSFEVARDKWYRRRERVNKSNMIIKYNDQNGFVDEYLTEFNAMEFKNKIFFTARKSLMNCENSVFIDNADEEGGIKDDTAISKLPIDVKGIINSISR